jgi:hypothetical protein
MQQDLRPMLALAGVVLAGAAVWIGAAACGYDADTCDVLAWVLMLMAILALTADTWEEEDI